MCTEKFSIPEEYDLCFSPVSDSWHGGLFSGNGQVGVMVYADHKRELLRLRLGNISYIDSRPEEMRFGRVSYDSPRLEIGSLYLKAPGIRERSVLRLDLRHGEIRGSAAGKSFLLFTARDPSVIVVETELEYAFFEPAEPMSPRYFVSNDMPETYVKNKAPVLKENSCTQSLFNGREFTTAWKQEKGTLFIASGFGNEAGEILKESACERIPQWKDELHGSYRKFYEKSFLSIPDPELERFYCINLYKWHSAAREENEMALDLLGPWTKKTAWCALWWNLNIQLTYLWLQTANRNNEMRPLIRMLSDHLVDLQKNAKAEGGMAIGRASSYDCRSPVKSEKGNLPWVCHILAETFFHTKDQTLLPLLKKLLCGVLKEYESLLYTDEDHVIHMRKTLPPEYGETEDAVFDLALLRKCIAYFLEFFADDEEKTADRARYSYILDHLAPFSADEETGYRMGKDLPLEHSHPHTSHLFMVYPLELPHDQKIALKSMERFLAMDEEFHGFSYTNTAAMFVRYGNGNRAEKLLHKLLDWMKERRTENMLYHENGNPVIETPFAFNSVLQDMLLLSSREKIRLFPALPDHWETASFKCFHCMNDITASASFDRKKSRITCTLFSPETVRILLELPDRSLQEVSLEAGVEKDLLFRLKA